MISFNLLLSVIGIFLVIKDMGLLHRIQIPITSLRLSNNEVDENEQRFTSLEDTEDPELLYNSRKIASDEYNKQITNIELSEERINPFDFNMEDFPDAADNQQSMKIKTPYNII